MVRTASRRAGDCIIKNAYFCYRNFDVCALFKTVQAFSDLLWLELNQRNRRGAPCSTN